MIQIPWWVLIVLAVLVIAERWSTGYRDKLALKLYDISADREVRYALAKERARVRTHLEGIAYRLANRLPPEQFEQVSGLHDELIRVAKSFSAPCDLTREAR